MPSNVLRDLRVAMHRYVWLARYSSNDVLSSYRVGVAFGIAYAMETMGMPGYPTLENARSKYGFKMRETRFSV